MNIYYIYAYIRSNGTPYYIGKGKGGRAWDKNHRVSLPKNPNQIVIMENNLTEIGALALERRLIRWWGRKDLGTGILRNMTDGGDGTSGRKQPHSQETKNKISQAKIGSFGHRKGTKHTTQTKEKMKSAWKNRTYVPLTPAQCKNISVAKSGVALTDAHKQKLKDAWKNRPKKHCIHCDKTVDAAAFGRYHGDKCKDYH